MKEKIILAGIGIGLVVFLLATDISDSVLGGFIEEFTEPDWSQIKERNIVKNSIPISHLEKTGQGCIASAESFEHIINHQYFVRSQDLMQELQYNEEDKTILVPCDELSDEKLKLHVWYATEEALKHSTKYEYFITPFEDTR
jgi:hypothetical protein